MSIEKTQLNGELSLENGMSQIDYNTLDVETNDDNQNDIANMEAVAETASKIRKQNPLKAVFSSGKNDKQLAENDELILGVIRSILNWLAVITSAETVRKDEYDSLTSKMLEFNDDMNERLEMDIKFKRAYETIIQKQQEQADLKKIVDALKKENAVLKGENRKIKFLSSIAILISVFAIVISFII